MHLLSLNTLCKIQKLAATACLLSCLDLATLTVFPGVERESGFIISLKTKSPFVFSFLLLTVQLLVRITNADPLV